MNRDEIKACALKFLREAGITQAPVDVEKLAIRVGAKVSYEPFEGDLSGVLVKDHGSVVIGVNSSHPNTRQRFTIAHECGHLLLKHIGDIFVDQTVAVMKRDGRSSMAIDQQEIEANRFAAELLMPEKMIVEAVKRRQQKKTDISASQIISELADEFQVSPQAMEYRLTNLGLLMPQ